MRELALLLLIVLAGCSPATVLMTKPKSDRFASVQLASRPGIDVWRDYHGIWSVDYHAFRKATTLPVYVLEGERKIGYACPGSIFMDNPPTITHTFNAGVSYILECSSPEPTIHEHTQGT